MNFSADFEKDPDATLDYGFDWGAQGWLDDGDTIASSTWLLPTGISKTIDTFNDSVTVVWLTGGTAFTTYYVTNRITTAQGRTDDRTMRIRVQDR